MVLGVLRLSDMTALEERLRASLPRLDVEMKVHHVCPSMEEVQVGARPGSATVRAVP